MWTCVLVLEGEVINRTDFLHIFRLYPCNWVSELDAQGSLWVRFDPIINNSYVPLFIFHRFKMAPHEQDSIPTEAIAAPSFKIVGKALEIPLVNDAVEAATKLHNGAVAYPYVNQVETIIGQLGQTVFF